MNVQQISVFLENRAGRLADVTRLLGEAQINIRALSLADTSDFGILRLIVDRTDDAYRLLKDSGYTASLTEVVAVEVPDRPGGLAGILAELNREGLNVEYMYAFVEQPETKAILVFRFEDPERAIASIRKSEGRVLTNEEVSAL